MKDFTNWVILPSIVFIVLFVSAVSYRYAHAHGVEWEDAKIGCGFIPITHGKWKGAHRMHCYPSRSGFDESTLAHVYRGETMKGEWCHDDKSHCHYNPEPIDWDKFYKEMREEKRERRLAEQRNSRNLANRVTKCMSKVLVRYPDPLPYDLIDIAFNEIERKCGHIK